MLVLTRKVGESILVGDNVRIVIQDIRGNRVRIAFDTPREIKVIREELKSHGDAEQVQ